MFYDTCEWTHPSVSYGNKKEDIWNGYTLIHKVHNLVNSEMAGEYIVFGKRSAHIAFLLAKRPHRTSAQ